ncbi:MAG: helix-turn-helix transcriptional regulator [Bacteroidales bacterium]|nr:helix-turn-helix transcriptional regulator [Bacteroidales bacterium]
MFKFKDKQVDSAGRLKAFFETAPFGYFLCEHGVIIDTNKLFHEMINMSESIKRKTELTEIFCFDNLSETKLLRCLNGISNYCSFQNIPLYGNKNIRFNIYLNVVDISSSNQVAGLIMQKDINQEKVLNPDHSNSSLYLNGIKTDNQRKFSSIISNHGVFTKRELQVLKLSAEGAPIKEIAHLMGISIRTVEKHRSNIFKKTNSGNIVEAVFYAKNKHLF